VPGPRVKLVLSYDGTEFSGSQRQPGKRTIQSELERAVGVLANRPTPVTLAGRTDAGVHALGQVAAFEDVRIDLPDDRLLLALHSLLPDDIAVQSVERVDSGFDPRHDAKWRAYHYRICNGPMNPLERRHELYVSQPLDLAAMIEAGEHFGGEHDFASFCGLGSGVPWTQKRTSGRGTVRRIHRCSVRLDRSPVIAIDVVGDAFLPKQVRTMVGALLEVGRGRRDPEWISRLLSERDRRLGPKTAPPYGLVLLHVGYSDFDFTLPAVGGEEEAIQGLVHDGSTNLFS
jgi:tRNA pseudouridine38-40 synthase